MAYKEYLQVEIRAEGTPRSDRIPLRYLVYSTIALVLSGCFDLKRASVSDAGLSACFNCVSRACDAEASTCQNDPRCWNRHLCLSSCAAGAAECRVRCSEDNPPTESAFALERCRGAHCRDDCDSCGASMFDGRSAECSECMQAGERCLVTADCADDRDCSSRIRRRMFCRDPFCAANDGFAYDSNNRPYMSFLRDELQFQLSSCSDECRWARDFSCYISHTAPRESALVSGNSYIELRPQDLLKATSLSSVKIEAIFENDGGIDTITIPETANGIYSIIFPGLFRGTFQLDLDGYFPLTVQISRPVVGSEAWTLPLTSTQLLSDFAAALSKGIDLVENGVLIVIVFDCMQNLAEGVYVSHSLENQENHNIVRTTSQGAVFADGEPSLTDDMGSVLYLNLPPGAGHIEFSRDAAGLPLGVMELTIRKGTMTFATIFPSSRTVYTADGVSSLTQSYM